MRSIKWWDVRFGCSGCGKITYRSSRCKRSCDWCDAELVDLGAARQRREAS
jgi:hypothetical protein